MKSKTTSKRGKFVFLYRAKYLWGTYTDTYVYSVITYNLINVQKLNENDSPWSCFATATSMQIGPASVCYLIFFG